MLDRVYPVEGSRAVHVLPPHRTMDAIRRAANWRGVPMIKRCPWSAEETAIAIAHYPALGAKATAAMLPSRAPKDVAAHANMRGVYRVREAA